MAQYFLALHSFSSGVGEDEASLWLFEVWHWYGLQIRIYDTDDDKITKV